MAVEKTKTTVSERLKRRDRGGCVVVEGLCVCVCVCAFGWEGVIMELTYFFYCPIKRRTSKKLALTGLRCVGACVGEWGWRGWLGRE